MLAQVKISLDLVEYFRLILLIQLSSQNCYEILHVITACKFIFQGATVTLMCQ